MSTLIKNQSQSQKISVSRNVMSIFDIFELSVILGFDVLFDVK